MYIFYGGRKHSCNSWVMMWKRKQGREQELNRWMERKRERINREVCEVVRLGREMQRNYGGKMVKKGWRNARRKERERLRNWERKRLRNTSGLSSDSENGRRKNIRGQWWRKTPEWERDRRDRGDKRTGKRENPENISVYDGFQTSEHR